MSEIVYAIKNKENKFATYGRTEFKEGLRFAKLYKSKKTVLQHYFNNTGDYNNLKVVKIEVKILDEEELNPNEFLENRR